MNIKERLKNDMIAAMKNKEKERLEAIRFIQAAIKKQEVDTRKDLDDAGVIAILNNQSKQRRDSIEQFRKGGREELAAKEEAELKILQTYLPEQFSSAELEALVTAAIRETGAAGLKDLGSVMKALQPRILGRADGSSVSAMVRQKLS
ncbi:MAG: GatB/YqeY domain-containing protein [Bdellovibrionales bacterium]|nr:GatB/YqeY domain-containing protein [Bdellovibrionales bacterium]